MNTLNEPEEVYISSILCFESLFVCHLGMKEEQLCKNFIY